MNLPKYSIGIGDRFGRQGVAQLRAVVKAHQRHLPVAPVWNKSHREHTIIGSAPGDVRNEADRAVQALGFDGAYFVDADHIGLETVEEFLGPSDFFTLDVAELIGLEPDEEVLADFLHKYRRYVGKLQIPAIDEPLDVSQQKLETAARKFLGAIKEAGRIYRRIERNKGPDSFVTEVSMDETERPQTPAEMFFILAAIAEEGIPAETIAPRFSGVREFHLPGNLKLSIHSGSDKFSIYGPMHDALKRFDAGVHLKTAGTTWLEELIGLAIAGGDALKIAKEIYRTALERFDELCAPYASVVDTDRDVLPAAETIDKWDGATFAAALRHDQTCRQYDPNLRQLLHIGYKIAAEMGDRFTVALEKHAGVIGENVTENVYDRHIRPLFFGE